MNNVSQVLLNSAVKKVTRLEIIDHTACAGCNGTGHMSINGQSGSFECPACHGSGVLGREVIFHNDTKEIEVSVQDDGRTLKIFIKDRE